MNIGRLWVWGFAGYCCLVLERWDVVCSDLFTTEGSVGESDLAIALQGVWTSR